MELWRVHDKDMIEASEASGKLPSFSTTVCHSTNQNVNSHTLTVSSTRAG